MRSFNLFEAPPRWERSINRGLMRSSESFLIGSFFLLDLFGISEAWQQYAPGTTAGSAGLVFFLCLFLFFVFFASYYVLHLCDKTRERLHSGVIDSDSRRTLLNVSYMGYRLYLILLLIPAIIFLAIQSIHP